MKAVLILLLTLTAGIIQAQTGITAPGTPSQNPAAGLDLQYEIDYWLVPEFGAPKLWGHVIGDDWRESWDDNYQLENFIRPMLEDPSLGLSGGAEWQKNVQ